MRVSINISRAEELGTILKRFGVELVEVFERKDPQYKALEELYNELRECNSLALLTVLNSIVSYQLSATGEEYWWEFARYKKFSSGVGDPEDLWRRFRNFLLSSRGNVASREIKIERLERIRRTQFHIELYVRYIEYIKNLDLLTSRLAEVLRQNIYDKTIVFSAKMMYYVSKICDIEPGGVEKIKIPVDRRVAAISYTSGLIDVLETKDIVEEIMREKERVIEAWSIVSKICDIPLIRLDSIIWFFGKYVRDRDPVEKALKDLSNMLRDVGNIKIFREFVQQFFIRRL